MISLRNTRLPFYYEIFAMGNADRRYTEEFSLLESNARCPARVRCLQMTNMSGGGTTALPGRDCTSTTKHTACISHPWQYYPCVYFHRIEYSPGNIPVVRTDAIKHVKLGAGNFVHIWRKYFPWISSRYSRKQFALSLLSIFIYWLAGRCRLRQK